MSEGAPGVSWIGGVWHPVGTKPSPSPRRDLLISYQIVLRNRLQLRHFSGLVPQARDVQRTFEAWLILAREEEVLVLADLVYSALSRRGYSLRGEWVKPVQPNQRQADETCERAP